MCNSYDEIDIHCLILYLFSHSLPGPFVALFSGLSIFYLVSYLVLLLCPSLCSGPVLCLALDLILIHCVILDIAIVAMIIAIAMQKQR